MELINYREQRWGYYPNLTEVALQSVTKITSGTIMNLAAPKGRAKHELLFNKPASGSTPDIAQGKHSMLCKMTRSFRNRDV